MQGENSVLQHEFNIMYIVQCNIICGAVWIGSGQYALVWKLNNSGSYCLGSLTKVVKGKIHLTMQNNGILEATGLANYVHCGSDMATPRVSTNV